MRKVLKSVLVVLAALALLPGCGHSAGVSASPATGTTTYTSDAFHYTIAYDPSQFEASPSPMPSNDQLNLTLRLVKTLAGPHYGSDEVFVSTASTEAELVNDLLGQWGKSDHPSWDAWIQGNAPASAGWTWRWATLGGAQGMRLEQTSGSKHSVCYLLFRGSGGYAVWLYDHVSQDSTVGPLLNTVVQSFRVTN